ncbi:MAG: acyl-ACP--UDP-N-acetylglucosamine O-acyltransferase [Nitrospirota bacterium]
MSEIDIDIVNGEIGIHPSAIIHPNAEIAEGVSIGPYSIIGRDVKIGKGTRIGPHIVIEGWTEIGENNTISQFSSLGGNAQSVKYKGEKTYLRIGNNNLIREYVTLNRGTVQGRGETVIGDNNFIMAYAHIAHDCKIGNNVIIANSVGLAGHIDIDDNAIIGGMTGVHQFVRIGANTMVGAMSGIPLDIPPYVSASGNRASLYGLNVIGLKRQGFSEELIDDLKLAYKIIFRSKLILSDAIKKVRGEIVMSKELEYFLNFIEASERGICR